MFNDFTVGCINPEFVQPLNKTQYFDQESIKKLEKSGLIVNLCRYGEDENSYTLAENQFLQMINNEHAVSTLKNLVDINLIRAVDIFSRTEAEQQEITPHMYQIPFKSTVQEFWNIYRKEIKIRADIVKEVTEEEWVIYDPIKHGIKFLGDCVEAVVFNDDEPAGLNYLIKNGNITLSREDNMKFTPSVELYETTIDTHTRRGHTHVEKPVAISGKFECKLWDTCTNINTHNNIEETISVQYYVDANYSIYSEEKETDGEWTSVLGDY